MRRTVTCAGICHCVRYVGPLATETGCNIELYGVVAHDPTPETVTCFACMTWDPAAEERQRQELRDRYTDRGFHAVAGFHGVAPSEDDDELP